MIRSGFNRGRLGTTFPRLATLAAIMVGVVIGSAGVARADVYYVDQSVTPSGDGLNWPTAFNDLQEALNVAEAGDEIWVAEGTYLPTDQVDPFDVRTVTFQLKTGVALYGGFPTGGGDGTFEARDPDTYVSTLSGDIGVSEDSSDNAYHVVIGSGTNATAVLDGVTITHGKANGPYSGGYNRGGGLYINNGSPAIINCTITENWANQGGGVANRNNSNTTLLSCVIRLNSAGSGGGVFNTGSCSPIVEYCQFSGNSAVANGGGIANEENQGAPIVLGCIFNGNSADYWGGAIHNDFCFYPTIGCVFVGNLASYGGGVFNRDVMSGVSHISNCVFSGNSAILDGGAICNCRTVLNCTFAGNQAAANGGAILSEFSGRQVLRAAR